MYLGGESKLMNSMVQGLDAHVPIGGSTSSYRHQIN